MSTTIQCNACHKDIRLSGDFINIHAIDQHAEYTYSFYCSKKCTEGK